MFKKTMPKHVIACVCLRQVIRKLWEWYVPWRKVATNTEN